MPAVGCTYRELASDLADRIHARDLTARFPSENELAADHGVSRLTARAALQELERWHLVRRTRGAGTFVAPQLDYTISRFLPPSWHEVVRRAGHRPRTELLAVDVEAAPPDVAADLGLAPGSPTVVVRRCGRVDDRPATVATSWFPPDVVPGWEHVGLGEGSLFDVLRQRFGHDPARRWARAQLEPPPQREAVALGHEGRPLAWLVESLNACAHSGAVLERSSTWMRADTFRVRFHLEAAGS